jgi:hypothetical protein
MKVKLHIFRYRCGTCGYTYEAAQMPHNVYGEFLLRSRGLRSEAYVNAMDDLVFAEVSRFVNGSAVLQGMRDVQRAAVTRKVFGQACDPDVDGSAFEIGLAPRCPSTGDEPDYWEATEPPILVERDVPLVTHRGWNALSESQKQTRLSSAIADAITA